MDTFKLEAKGFISSAKSYPRNLFTNKYFSDMIQERKKLKLIFYEYDYDK